MSRIAARIIRSAAATLVLGTLAAMPFTVSGDEEPQVLDGLELSPTSGPPGTVVRIRQTQVCLAEVFVGASADFLSFREAFISFIDLSLRCPLGDGYWFPLIDTTFVIPAGASPGPALIRIAPVEGPAYEYSWTFTVTGAQPSPTAPVPTPDPTPTPSPTTPPPTLAPGAPIIRLPKTLAGEKGKAKICSAVAEAFPAVTRPNLVIVTHGWNGPLGAGNEHPDYYRLVSSIIGYLEKQGKAADWDVRFLNWSVLADGNYNALPWAAYGNAKVVGDCLGEVLADAELKHVHLLGHSAGATLVERASKKVGTSRKVVDGAAQPTVHLTLFDAYLPQALIPFGLALGSFGNAADFVDHYIYKDAGEPPWLAGDPRLLLLNTDVPIPSGCNLDVTEIRRYSFPNGHGAPTAFYKRTVDVGGPAGAWGFGKSKEVTGSAPSGGCGDGMTPGRLTRIDADGRVVSPSLLEEIVRRFPIKIPGGLFERVTGTGTVESGTTPDLRLRTSSPVAARASAFVELPSNAVQFGYRFTSTPAGQSVASLYVDGVAVWEDREDVDSRAGVVDVVVLLPRVLNHGVHTFEFRLETIGSTAVAEFEVHDFSVGEVTIEDPQTSTPSPSATPPRAPAPPNTGTGPGSSGGEPGVAAATAIAVLSLLVLGGAWAIRRRA